MNNTPTTTETIEALRTHIEASAPCMLKGVLNWAKVQGFGGSKAIAAVHALKINGTIFTDFDDDGETIVELV